ncbi:hypothetical protein DSM106972_049530 [Dulcicalothrix desertica PCC 7102]|uniref:Uncharacterized protein n=1 Tax=Dulcicalothrix desertica PCC 7102 TaxID=232991 RepID=A0A3S1ALR6_9CYAN|nr:hypothetical protein [Dulcicalothrix desertica]RUT04039.1 hypothetical protein DSM106972_049530 [Dulcicalothrix desertica PCC 7102]TWH43558.1 hypothetical protein CAL7102_07291 [Dulcicalothrix desertica PCC 7102]
MSYQFKSLYSTDSALNYDVTTSDDNQYMGRLYILTAENPVLQNLGIEKEWFLAHESGEFMICGHINNVGEWSLSSYRSLEPSLEYTTKSQIFDQVFSHEYVQEVLHSQKVIQSSEFLDDRKRLNDNNDASDDTKETVNSTTSTQLSISIPNLEMLGEIILRSSQDDLLTLQSEEVDMYQIYQSFEQEALVMTDIITNEIMSTLQLERTELLEIEQAIIDKIIEEYQTHDTSDFLLHPTGKVTIHVEEDYFVLSDSVDGHTILAATFDGEVMEELKQADAIEFTSLLQSHEIEVSTLLSSQSHSQTENANLQKGIDYGT